MYRVGKIIFNSDGSRVAVYDSEWHGCPPGVKPKLQAGRAVLRCNRNSDQFRMSESDRFRQALSE